MSPDLEATLISYGSGRIARPDRGGLTASVAIAVALYVIGFLFCRFSEGRTVIVSKHDQQPKADGHQFDDPPKKRANAPPITLVAPPILRQPKLTWDKTQTVLNLTLLVEDDLEHQLSSSLSACSGAVLISGPSGGRMTLYRAPNWDKEEVPMAMTLQVLELDWYLFIICNDARHPLINDIRSRHHISGGAAYAMCPRPAFQQHLMAEWSSLSEDPADKAALGRWVSTYPMGFRLMSVGHSPESLHSGSCYGGPRK